MTSIVFEDKQDAALRDFLEMLDNAKDIRVQVCRMENICKKYPSDSDMTKSKHRAQQSKIKADLKAAFKQNNISLKTGANKRVVVISADLGLTLDIMDCICFLLSRDKNMDITLSTTISEESYDSKELRITIVDIFKNKEVKHGNTKH